MTANSLGGCVHVWLSCCLCVTKMEQGKEV